MSAALTVFLSVLLADNYWKFFPDNSGGNNVSPSRRRDYISHRGTKPQRLESLFETLFFVSWCLCVSTTALVAAEGRAGSICVHLWFQCLISQGRHPECLSGENACKSDGM